MEITINDLQLISSHSGYVNLYVVATASEGGKVLTEEFHIGRQWVGQRIITDNRGWMLSADGKYYDPELLNFEEAQPLWEKEEVRCDLKQEIVDVVTKTMRGKLVRKARQDKPEVLKIAIQRKIPVWNNVDTLPLDVRRLVGRLEIV
ncbi:hypothetical protein LCGC14_2510310 [marine sediment metagenome]|uniref:Uncharacterized protein n=1 Tax=marine sediment metagenome TaxID=412755 RepID=A0A0F9BM77_9ZZZZ